MRRIPLHVSLLSLLVILLLQPAQAQYSVVILSPPDGFDYSVGYGVGGEQQVGMGNTHIYHNTHALLWSGSTASVIDLHPNNLAFSDSWAFGVGEEQQVGYGYGDSTAFTGRHALLWTGLAITAVDLHPAGFSDTYAFGVGGRQQVGYGTGILTNNSNHALLWSGSAASVIDLNPDGFSNSYAFGVQGEQQVGYGYGSNGTHALLWSGSAASTIDLNPIWFGFSYAFGVAGMQQVGYGAGITTGNRTHALLWSGSAASAIDLHPDGFDYSEAYGVSSGKQVGKGYTHIGADDDAHALLWSGSAASVVDLHRLLPPEYVRSEARAISFNGDIVGTAYRQNGNSVAVLWKRDVLIEPKVDVVKMAGSHLLAVKVTGHFSNDANTSKALSISTTLNGVLLDKDTCADCTWSAPNGTSGEIEHTFQINLMNTNVPRFVDNQRFSVTAIITDGQSTSQSAAFPAVILLPVVLVPGIFNGQGGDSVFRNIYSYLESTSDSRLRATNVLGEGYQSSNNSPYRTLYALSYDTTNAPFTQGATALSVLIFFTIRDQTYADRVQIASHSKGGLVTRQYIVTGGKDYVKWHIMCAPPNTGSWWAAAAANALNKNLNNLRPTWKWYRKNAGQRYIETTENQELRALNGLLLPHIDSQGREVRYTIIFSESNDTQAAFTWSGPLFWRSIPGDDIVTASSARGYLTDMNTQGTLGSRIPAFAAGNIEELSVPGGHSGYIEQQSVMVLILNRFMGNI